MSTHIEWVTTAVTATRDGRVVARATQLNEGEWWAHRLDGVWRSELGHHPTLEDAQLAISQALAEKETALEGLA